MSEKLVHMLQAVRKRKQYGVRLDAEALSFAKARGICVSLTLNNLFIEAMCQAGMPRETLAIKPEDIVGRAADGTPITKEMVADGP